MGEGGVCEVTIRRNSDRQLFAFDIHGGAPHFLFLSWNISKDESGLYVQAKPRDIEKGYVGPAAQISVSVLKRV